jgi:hypothetical protein
MLGLIIIATIILFCFVMLGNSDTNKKKPTSFSVHKSKETAPVNTKKPELDISNNIRNDRIIPATTDIDIPLFKIHDDIKGLIWIGDGKYKNYTPENKYGFTAEFEGIKITFSCNYGNEPSIIYTKQPVKIPEDESLIPRPPYYPTYEGLTPEQKWIYLKLLANPYDTSIDIGYVFILYYGLERHLLNGDFERAFRVILKLRDVHSNNSFQQYSANALILSAMLHKKGEFVLEFINSLDKEHELNFWNNLLLISYYSFNVPLYPKDIMRMSASFGFDNKNYIKKYPEIFENNLREIIREKTGKDTVLISECITSTELRNIEVDQRPIFANTSMNDQRIPVPLLSENYKLREVMCGFLENAHETTKKKLAEMRKTNKMPKSAYEPKKREKKPEREILSIINEKATLSSRKWLYRTNDNELLGCLSKSKHDGIILNTHFIDIITKHMKYTLFRDPLKVLPLPAAFREVKSILQKMIKEKKAIQEDPQELYEMLYGFGVLSSMSIPYSERLEMPGYNIFEIMPGGSLIKLPMPFEEIGYEGLDFNKSICKVLQELWGIPNNHITLNEYYPEIWKFYENQFERKYKKKYGIPWRI